MSTKNLKIRKLQPGQEVVIHFHGSKNLGNEGYYENATFVTNYGDPGENYAEFAIEHGDIFTAYFWKNRWRYGSSAEVMTVHPR